MEKPPHFPKPKAHRGRLPPVCPWWWSAEQLRFAQVAWMVINQQTHVSTVCVPGTAPALEIHADRGRRSLAPQVSWSSGCRPPGRAWNPSNSSWLPRGSALLTQGPQLQGKTVESPLEGPRSLASQHILKPQAPLPPVSPYAHSPLFISALEHPRGFCTSMPLHLWFTRGKIPLPPLFLLVEILPIRQG